MKHYRNLWKFAPGAMTLGHVIIVGFLVVNALVRWNPLAALAAFGVTLLVAVALVPVCMAWDIGRR